MKNYSGFIPADFMNYISSDSMILHEDKVLVVGEGDEQMSGWLIDHPENVVFGGTINSVLEQLHKFIIGFTNHE